ncbi:hypothetical protein QR680_008407 [Steinernema hermaphroditum]|uniref:Acyltransferase 3 domain-containing protein n=1 Tax=Steinernema hermaphroditum TaxID=289476 RepID=A0AA39IGH1_9BILA|nr:hypothetical protein QR680_008407 [Steinernema hermaphroditum]
MHKRNMPKERRLDLQGIRGYAILLVVLFHLWPKGFPNGFIGVDIFFVMSGYFMSSHYGCKTIDVKSHLDFYSRRLCRVLPLYYFIFPPVLYFAKRHFVDDDFAALEKELRWALALGTNIKNLFEWKTYFSRVESIAYLVHTWSLCCEIQYYLLAPALFFFERRKRPVGVAALLAVSATSLFLHVSLDGSWSYEILFSRIWQFQCGYLAFRLENLESPAISLFSIIALHLFFLPIRVPQLATRLVGSALAVLLISQHETSKKSPATFLLTNRAITYLGDLSYAWYLFHWIVMVFVYYTNAEMHFGEKLQVLFISLGISIFVHHTLEKPLLKDRFSSFLFTLLCFATTVYVAFFLRRECDRSFVLKNYPCPVSAPSTYWSNWTYINPCAPYSTRVKQAIKLNARYIDKNWYPPHYTEPNEADFNNCERFWQWQGHVDGNGSLKVLVIGNSYSVKLIPAITTVLYGRYSVLENFMVSGCEPLINDVESDSCCAQLTRFMFRKVKDMRPDLLFVIQRYSSAFSKKPFDTVNDTLVHLANSRLATLQNHTKLIFLSGPMPMFDMSIGPEVARRLKMDLPLDSLFFTRDLNSKLHENTKLRLASLKCPKCRQIDMLYPFCGPSGHICRLYDEESKLALYEDGMHMSHRASELMIPHLQDMLDTDK